MLKLKNAVNSFIITKKRMNKKKKTRRMRGGMGMFRKTKTPEEVKLINENLIKEKVSKAESPSKGKGSSMFSFLSKPPVNTAQPAASVEIGPKTYTVTTSPECTTTQCVATATLQTGGSRKSKRSKKTLKGGRRRR